MPSVIRNSAKALILRDGKLLTTKNLSQFNEIYYLLPGGGVNHGETVVAALERECMEEAGVRVKVKNLRYVREYIADHHEFTRIHAGIHQIEYMFECELLEQRALAPGHTPDEFQTGVEWLPLSGLHDFLLFPKVLKTLIKPDGTITGDVYLGDVN